MRQSHTLLLLRGGLHQNHAPLPHIGDKMFKKTEKGLKAGELNLVMAKSNCGKSSFIVQELTDKENEATIAKPTQNDHKESITD